MDVSLSAAERHRHATSPRPWGDYRHPHQQPVDPGFWPGPWNDPIPDDADSAPLPEDDDRPVRLGGSFRPPPEGYDWAIPYNVRVAGSPGHRTVYEYKEDPNALVEFFRVLAILFGVRPPSHRIPIVSESRLPWVSGHPQQPPTTGDRHYVVLDPELNELFEAGVTRLGVNPKNILTGGQRWWFNRVTRWDLTRPYSEQADKKKGSPAARMPMLPMTVRFDELARGRIDHVVGVALPRYQPGPPVWPAMGTDGRLVRDQNGVVVREVPVVAGQRLQLRPHVLEELRDTLPPGSHRLVVAEALHEFGLIVADTTARNHGSAWVAPDGRWEDSDLPGFELPLSAFAAVDPFPHPTP